MTRLAMATTLLAVAVAPCGCTSSPKWAGGNLAQSALAPAAVAQASLPGPGPILPAEVLHPSQPSQATSAQTTDPESLEQIAAAIQALEALDPAARNELLENLAQTDPTIRPLVTRQVRAGLALRRQAQQREADCLGPEDSPEGRFACLTSPTEPTARRPPDLEPSGAQSANEASPADRGRQASTNAPGQAFAQRARSESPGPHRAATDGRVARRSSAEERSASGPPSPVSPASYEPTAAEGWEGHVDKAIELLGSAVDASPQSDCDFARHARLRMLYLSKGQRDEALRPIPALAPAMQDFWSKQFYGLATLLDPKLITESGRRSAEAKQHLEGAVAKLGDSCPLVVRNLAFVTEIQSYGSYKPFDKYEFVPGQRVLLYAEVENFTSSETARGFHTVTRSSYQVFDSSGRRIDEHEFSPSEEYCRRPRRDFFIGYEFCLPERIYPGKHVLQLTVADLNSQKIGQTVIEFTVKSADD